MASKHYSKRVATQANFERTRENMAEFERAARAGKLLTDAFRAIVDSVSDARQTIRLSRAMSKVIKSDPLNERGQRKVSDGNLQLLRGFDFNLAAKLSRVFFAPYTATIERSTGTLKVDIPAFVSRKMLKAPPNTTHFTVVCGAAELNFDSGTHQGAISATAELAYSRELTADISLSNMLTPNSTDILFLVLGVTYYQFVNGQYYTLNDEAYNTVGIILVDAPNA
ncbi:hypothetical protein [uncultured Chitinophaga sp.]|jgi:hypothetical protein|uniref:hypothetical protein n=1 Tax=uncultured Chitinophaga sp. TaxID=339340 RepID=UPI00262C3FC1|nr:hypothetical protein [uncultured Chitinophaga sp.]